MLRLISHILPENQFARSVFALASGTVAAQLILIVASPILTRLYAPSEFGILSVFVSALGLFGSISALRFELALPLPKDDRDATAIMVLGLLIVAGLSCALFAVSVSIGENIVVFLNIPELAPYLGMLPVAFFFTGFFLILNMWCVRYGMFGEMAKAKMAQSVTIVAVQLLGAAFGAITLVVSRIFGQFAAALLLFLLARKAETSRVRSIRTFDLEHAAITYRKFPLISTWAALASSVGASVTPLLFASSFGLDIAGYYAMTMMVMVSPMSILGIAVQNAFYRRAVDAHRRGHLWTLIFAVHSRLVLATMPFFLLLPFILPSAFVIVFGERWVISGVFAVWILPWMFLQLTITPCTGIFPILDRLGVAFFFEMSLALAPFIAFFASQQLSDDPILAVQILSVLAGTLYLVRVIVAYKLSGGPALSGLLVFARWFPVALLGVSPMLTLVLFWPEGAAVLPFWGLGVGLSLAIILMITWKVWRFLPPLEVDTPLAHSVRTP